MLFEVKEKVQKNDVKVGIGQMKTKTFFVLFSNAHSILELLFCNLNLTKLVYQTLVSSNCRARDLKLNKHLKKGQIFASKLG